MRILRKTLLLFMVLTGYSFGGVLQEFENFYYSDQLSSRHCKQNVKLFLKDLEGRGFDTSSIKVVEITAPSNAWGSYRVVALNSRWGIEKEGHLVQIWGYHVIAVYEGFVLDFSFDKRPKALLVKDYIEQMFVAKHPFILHTNDFRARGKGPYFTPEISRETLSDYVFKTISFK